MITKYLISWLLLAMLSPTVLSPAMAQGVDSSADSSIAQEPAISAETSARLGELDMAIEEQRRRLQSDVAPPSFPTETLRKGGFAAP